MRSFIFALCTLLQVCSVNAQTGFKQSGVQFSAEVGAIVASSRQTPFWLRANQFGTVPSVGPAGILRLRSKGVFYSDSTSKKWFLGYSVETIGNIGANSRLLVPEAYMAAGKGYLEIVIGRRKEVLGLVDTTLSSGSYSWSGNAMPIPKIQIGTRGFAPLHFTNDLIAVNVFLAHGWFPNTDTMRNSYLHQKAFYGRIGKPNWKIKFYGGILHNVQWGGSSRYLGKNFSSDGGLPSSFKDYLYIISARKPKQTKQVSNHDLVNQLGNHVGSIDVGAELSFNKWKTLLYYQHPFEDKSGLAMINLPDGLYGLSLKRNESISNSFFKFDQILVEYLTTMSQSGSSLNINRRQYEGIDDYFNNFQYMDGWSSSHQIIGTPLLSRRQDVKLDWQNIPGGAKLTVVNNRLNALHIAFKGSFQSEIEIQSLATYSSNFGLIRNPFPGAVNQFSGIVRLSWPMKALDNTIVRMAFAVDRGNLLQNSVGGMLSLQKIFD